MRSRVSWLALAGLGFGALGLLRACGGSGAGAAKPAADAPVAVSQSDAGPDMSRCDFKGRADREVSETAGPGAVQPNVRRVFAVIGQGDEARRVIICREVDTNLDGVKDVVRVYSDQGESLGEQADTNYDGRIDTWITFAGGRIARLELDTDYNGTPDETQFYTEGVLSRIERDTNKDGKPDVWEIYVKGHLQRMGVDIDGDGHVDRWDRDVVALRLEEERDREEQEKAARDRGGPASDAGPADAATKD